MEIFELDSFDRYEYLIAVVDVIAVAMSLLLLRKVKGLIADVDFIKELTKKDNYAFGISSAGALLALAIIMTGVVSGDPSHSIYYEFFLVLAYGLVGILLMITTRKIFDNFVLKQLSIKDELHKGNIAVGIIDAANMIATAIVVKAVMLWVDTESFLGLFIVIAGFFISQLLLILVTFYRSRVYAWRHDGASLQAAFRDGKQALAIRYLGHKIGVALAIVAASGIIEYQEYYVLPGLLGWFVAAFFMTILVSLFAIGARLVVLPKVDVKEEVDIQNNFGVAMIEAVIYISMGVVLAALLGTPTS